MNEYPNPHLITLVVLDLVKEHIASDQALESL